ncbi:Bifunctional hemolysin/adenylate cyclase precursor [Roseivivax jejudonensis]|uniref:Bifunctional hemolysin/adenylate cyclase n=1 Tax=Roseivivax jejudonensis TaxID=1529041 RepID=A0A1X6ZNU8_9RHOB|nr:choice-of-anchor L domain-containing protein [Roseivivax jejudonensis]SLN56746.1 Bifunctional hemolysin/adenylate cyclase precursor [Roseivivax jejudonensis]
MAIIQSRPVGSATRNATIDGSAGADVIPGIAGESNVLSGLGGNDRLVGAELTDFLFGGSGDDTLIGGAGGDFLQGDAGDDVFILGSGDDVIHGFTPTGTEPEGSADEIDASALAFAGSGTAGLSLTFSADGAGSLSHGGDSEGGSATFTGIERIRGTERDDDIAGGAGFETIIGGGGDDVLSAGAGGADITAGAGDDTVTVGAGAGSYSGGGGIDALSGEGVGGPMRITLDAAGRGTITAGGMDSDFSGFEIITGGASNDTILGSESDDILEGAAGNDTIDGGGGTDEALFDARSVEAQFFVTEAGDYQVSAPGLGTDLLRDIETFTFSDATLTLDDVRLIAEPALGDDGGDDDDGGRPDDDDDDRDGLGQPVDAFPPVGEAITSRGDPAIAAVLFGTSGITPDSIDYVGAPNAIALLPEGYTITDGATSIFIERGIFLTTGGGPGTENTENDFSENLNEPGDPRLTVTASSAFPEADQTNDAAVVTLTIDGDQVSTGTLAFELFFGSDEYPEFADSAFVDIAAVYVNGTNYALFGNDPSQPLSIVGDAINTPGNFFDNTDDTFDTEYDGFSTLLTVLVPIEPGINEVVIGIADSGDSILDSGLFIGNAEATTIDATGTFVNVIGTGLSDDLSVNAAPQIVSLNGGADTVTGRAANFGSDIIRGWSDNDRLVLNGNLSAASILTTLTADGIEIGIDANENGTPESTFTVAGDFFAADIIVTDTDSGVEISSVGVRPAAPVVRQGGNGNERLFGDTGDDDIDGGAGNDSIAADEGDDRLAGGAGNDEILGSAGRDTILGGAGNDRLQGNDDADTILGGSGDDDINGGGDNDSLYGEAGDDTISGGAGNDTIGGSDGGDRIFGGSGNDFIGGGFGADRIRGGDGSDTIGAGEGDDFVVGDGGADRIAGGAGNDELDGEFDDDMVAGSYGDDLVIGGRGDDDLGGGSGRDTLVGGLGNDTMGAGLGDDTVRGGDGDDFLAGGGRDDLLDGGEGNDTLNGGSGSDILTGGAGADFFVWNARDAGDIDILTDYEDGIDVLRVFGATADDLEVTETVLGGTLYAVAEFGDLQIWFDSVAASEIDASDFGLL